MTPVFCCSFECGQLGVASATPTHWDGSQGNVSPTFETSSPLSGLRSLRCNTSAQTSYTRTPSTYGAGRWAWRFRVQFSALPSVDCNLSAVSLEGVFFKASDSKIYAGSAGVFSGATGVSVTTGVPYYIDVKVDNTANPHLVDVSVNGTACGQGSRSATGAVTAQRISIGLMTACTGTALFDDFILSTTLADYPIGDGQGEAVVPAGDGTHTFTSTHACEGTNASPTGGSNITSATTDSFNWVNGKPLLGGATDNTRLINQKTAASTEYAEWTIEQTSQTVAPQAVEVLCAYKNASTAACDSTFKLNDNGTEDTIITQTGGVGFDADKFATKQYATMVGGGAWTLARFKALRLRFGYAADATPDVYCRGWMIEADFPAPAATSLVLPSRRGADVRQKRRYTP